MPERAALRAMVAGLAILAATPAPACGPDSECPIGERHYLVAMPEGHDGAEPVGALIFAHGYRGTARGVMASETLRATATDLGMALVAVQTAGEDWSIPGAPSDTLAADDLAYFDAVRADLLARFPVDSERMAVAGFSAGGMMTWTLACRRSGDYAAFLPVAGTFWRPVPDTCEAPVASVVHLHGDDDPIVPLAGRAIADTHQGAVADAIAMYADFGGFGPPRAHVRDPLRCEERRRPRGEILALCLFEGGHRFDARLIGIAWDMVREAAGE